ERVPAGTVFEFEIVLRVFKEGEQDKHIDILKQGLKLLENDALGGFGSRGSGRIKFFDLTLDGEKFTLNDVKL
ncbi:MAG: type III-A CRISPR-associated RAMP protein Csm3, partial [Candidatus Cloacimonetes bacterium]|nr:type III-A CRISPR-associated RAMP protein Csm3 [Candidatus Cloacimonadota bacterium]